MKQNTQFLKKEEYLLPEIEISNFVVEQGFTESNPIPSGGGVIEHIPEEDI